MRMCRTFLTVLIAVGLHVSLCTGGIFALLTSSADYLAYSGTNEVGPMSYGAIGYLSCESGKRKDAEVGVHIGGCDQKDACFSQAGSILEDRSIVLTAVTDIAVPVQPDDTPVSHAIPLSRYQLARAGPLYEDAESLAHSLIKIE